MPNLRISLVQGNPNQAYYARGVINGNVLLDIDEPKSRYPSVSLDGPTFGGRRLTQLARVKTKVLKLAPILRLKPMAT